MKINQLWQKHDIYLTHSRCIIMSGQADCPFPQGLPQTGCHILIRYTIWVQSKKEKQSCIEQNQIQTDENSRGRFNKIKICWKYLTFETKIAIIILLLERLRPNFAHFEEFWRHSSTAENRWMYRIEDGSKKPYII